MVRIIYSAVAFLCVSASAGELHWSYRAPEATTPPTVQQSEWVRTPVDTFILQRLEQEGIQPAPETDRRTWIRRVSFDLTGLPPTPDEVEAFLADGSPDAYERVVDRLLASPHYGEKWARWWLDLAAYADSDGYLSDFPRPWAWRYRDWVVEAFNADLPFDAFTIEQIAGDLLPQPSTSQRIATGFLRNTLNNREGGADLEEFRTRQTAERAIAVGTIWLGATLDCAQCHDHKYDPVSQREFYQFYAFFNNADEVNIPAPLGDEWGAFESAWPDYVEKRTTLLAPVADSLNVLQTQWEQKLLEAAAHPGGEDYRWDRAWEVLGLAWGQMQGEGQLEGTQIVRTPWDERTQTDRFRIQDYFLRNGSLIDEAQFTALGVADLIKQLDELDKTVPPVSRAPAIRQSRMQRQAHIHVRGDFRTPGDAVEANAPAVMGTLSASSDPPRLALARWLVDPSNPLTTRVTVNRIWQELFGQGLVTTSDDFGTRGAAPSHPELLDWLAVAFRDQGWHMKALMKDLVLSATYRQSSHARPELAERDPSNRLLARYKRQRLSGELVRDNALAVSGLLNPAVGGPSVRPAQPASVSKEGFDNKWETSEGTDRYRRGLYTWIQRTSPYGQFVNFDFPSTSRACTRRERSNTPLQALNLLNDPNFFEAAQALAGRVLEGAPSNDDARIDRLYALTLARPPKATEKTILTTYLAEQTKRFESEPDRIAVAVDGPVPLPSDAQSAAWVAACSLILNLDEFITKE